MMASKRPDGPRKLRDRETSALPLLISARANIMAAVNRA